MPNSRDNVNRMATVKCFAYDGLGEVVDQAEAHGRKEPSLQFLDFMMYCEAAWGKQITRFTCEVAYVLVALIFLSSMATHACARSYDAASTSIPATSGYVHSVSFRDSSAYDWLVVRTRPPASKDTFERSHEPILWVVPWPPFAPETETVEWYRQVHSIMKQLPPEPEKPRWKKKILSVTAGLIGVALLFYSLGWRRFYYHK